MSSDKTMESSSVETKTSSVAAKSAETKTETKSSSIRTLSAKKQLMIFIDWDDTMIPSTYLIKMSLENKALDTYLLQNLKTSLINLIKCLMSITDLKYIYIVSNSKHNWIKYQCSLYNMSDLWSDYVSKLNILTADSIDLKHTDQQKTKEFLYLRALMDIGGPYIANMANYIVLGNAKHDHTSFIKAINDKCHQDVKHIVFQPVSKDLESTIGQLTNTLNYFKAVECGTLIKYYKKKFRPLPSITDLYEDPDQVIGANKVPIDDTTRSCNF